MDVTRKAFVSRRVFLENGITPAAIIVENGKISKILPGDGAEVKKNVNEVSHWTPVFKITNETVNGSLMAKKNDQIKKKKFLSSFFLLK